MDKIFKDNSGRLRSGWKINITLISVFLIPILIELIIVFGSIALGLIIGYDSASFLDKLNSGNIMSGLQLIMQIINYIIMISIVIFFWIKLEHKNISAMGLTNFKKGYKKFISGLLLGIASMTIIAVMLVLTDNAKLTRGFNDANVSIDLFNGLVFFIFVGFFEEIFSRGYIMSVLKQTNSIAAVYIISAIIFSLLHVLNNNASILGLINIALIGLLFAHMFVLTKNIWLPIGFHITWNYFQGNIFGFAVSGTKINSLLGISVESNNIINGGAFGVEGGILTTIIIVLLGIFIHLYYKKDFVDFMM